MKNNKNVWYAPLLAQFQAIEDAMPLSRFAAIEAVLLHPMLIRQKPIFCSPNINLLVPKSARPWNILCSRLDTCWDTIALKNTGRMI